MAMEQAIGDGVDHRTSVAQVIDLYPSTSHAKKALVLACRHSYDHRVDARAVLWGVLESPKGGGTAYRKFQELVGREPPREARQSGSTAEIYLNEPLLASLEPAREFWKRRGQVWGRDLITWALLAKDPSLDEWLTTPVLTQLRDDWFEFVAQKEPQVWTSWWNAAGIPLPHAEAAAPQAPEAVGPALSLDALTPGARKALAYANAIREHDEVHLDELLWGLVYVTEENPSGTSRLRREGVTAKQLGVVLDDAAAGARHRPATVSELSTLPPLSQHAEQVLHQAVEIQLARSKPAVDEDVVLQGLLRVQTSDVARRVLHHWPKLLAGQVIVVDGPGGEIPDAGEVALKAEVVGEGAVASLQVQLAIAHPWRGDLQVSLLNPAGHQVVLSGRQGGSADNLSIELTSAVHPGLRQFIGASVHGPWKLVVKDATAGDVGRLEAWRLTLFIDTPDVELAAHAGTLDVALLGADVPPTVGDIVDCLDVEDEARAFARIAAARATRPPLAIGVFGEWGAGKTFFMELMLRHVAFLADQTKGDEKSGKQQERTFHDRIVQIRFNAWHYMENNLWASLVDYILTELDRWLQSDDPARDKAKVDALFGKLLTAQQLELSAIRKTIEARQERKRAQKELVAARAAVEEARVTSDLWRAVQRTLIHRLPKETQEELDKAAHALGIVGVTESLRELATQLDRASTLGQQLRMVCSSVLAKVLANRLLALVVLLAMFGSPLVVQWVKPVVSLDWVQNLSEMSASVVGVVASLTSALVFYVTRAQAALNTLRGFRSSIDAAVEERRKSPKFAVAQAKLAKAEADLAGVARTVAEASQAVQDAQTEWHASTPRGRLNDFIRAKVLNGDYAKHLGIVAAIRRDFEHLAHIMAEEGDGQAEADYKRARDEHKRELERLLEDGKGLFTPAELADLGQRISTDEGAERDRFFERIILYIDDLDRCPEDKVVDVLQAIHLLLYFPLFVVVVAVDARWVSRALQTKYPNLLSENVIYDHVGARSAWPKRSRTNGASSQDYLEKIFQIPYWVRPMDGKASADYVTHLLNGSLKAEASRKSSAEDSAKLEGAARQRPRRTDVSKAADSVAHASGGTSAGQATQQASAKPQADSSSHPAPKSSPERPSAPAVSTSQPLSRAQIEAQQRIEARSLSLTEHEEKLLKAMAPFAGDSPRRGLRFVNTYRLVRTSLSETERVELLGKTGEKFGFRALMTQLAIATGSPEFSQRYFEALAAKPASLEALLDAAKPGGSLSQTAAWKRLEGAVGALNQGTGPRDPHSEAELLELLGTWGEVARRYSFSARPH